MTTPNISHHLVVTEKYVPAAQGLKWLKRLRKLGVRRITFVTIYNLERIRGMEFSSVEIQENLVVDDDTKALINSRIRSNT